MLPRFTALIAIFRSACPVSIIRTLAGLSACTFSKNSIPFMPGILKSDTSTGKESTGSVEMRSRAVSG
jgi:hypothetical protein